MLFKIVGRVVGTCITIVLLTVLRLYLFGLHPGYRPSGVNTATSQSVQPAAYPQATPSTPPDHSGWVIYSSTDPLTGLSTRHAKLRADTLQAPGQATRATDVLELLKVAPDGYHILISLHAQTACPVAATIAAQFDRHPATTFAVKSVSAGAACNLEVVDYETFMVSLRDADVLSVSGPQISPPALATRFNVAGLTWD